MDFNDKGQLISEFRPPRDERGNGLSYEDYRAFIGVPMTKDEIEARDAMNEADRRYRQASAAAYRLADRCEYPMCGLTYAHAGEHDRRRPHDHRVKS